MPNLAKEIKYGINFEENLVDYLVDEMTQAKELNNLDPAKRLQIIRLLEVLARDSRRHAQLLIKLLDKYKINE